MEGNSIESYENFQFVLNFCKQRLNLESFQSISINTSPNSIPDLNYKYKHILKEISLKLDVEEKLLDVLFINYFELLRARYNANENAQLIYDNLLAFYKKTLFSLFFDRSKVDNNNLYLLVNISPDQVIKKVNLEQQTQNFKDLLVFIDEKQNEIDETRAGKVIPKNFIQRYGDSLMQSFLLYSILASPFVLAGIIVGFSLILFSTPAVALFFTGCVIAVILYVYAGFKLKDAINNGKNQYDASVTQSISDMDNELNEKIENYFEHGLKQEELLKASNDVTTEELEKDEPQVEVLLSAVEQQGYDKSLVRSRILFFEHTHKQDKSVDNTQFDDAVNNRLQ